MKAGVREIASLVAPASVVSEILAWLETNERASLTTSSRPFAHTPYRCCRLRSIRKRCYVRDVEMLACRGALRLRQGWVSVVIEAERRRQRVALKGLVPTGGTAGDVDAGPTLHPLRHAPWLRRWWWLHLSQCLTA